MAGEDAAAHIPGGGGAALYDADHRHVFTHPSELINEPLLTRIFAALREEFDYVIVGWRPLPTVVDTMTLGNYEDLVLSVVNVAHTPRRAFAAHMETLSTLDRRQGMIINGVLGQASGYGYGYGYGDRRNGGWLGLCGRG